MVRQDLLALTTDDLIILSNRGLVKRALKELDEGITCEVTADVHGNVTVRCSDEVECILPAKEELSDRHCSCSATTICRHLIRSILVYQRTVDERDLGDTGDKGELGELQSKIPTPRMQPWNPGDISDLELANYFNKATLTRIRRQFESSHVIELTRSSKPVAQIHTLSYTVRFLVPGDIRYTYCDCAEIAPCRHVLFAIWAFRLLDSSILSGIISTQKEAAIVPVTLLDEIEQTLQALLEVGISGLALASRLRRLEQSCRKSELMWHADILAELVLEKERYDNRDARFSPTKVVELVGELCIRSDAVRNDTGAVPQLFIRGSQADKLTEIGAARLIGLGCGVQVRRQNVLLTAYLQDTDSGTVVAVCQDFLDPPEDNQDPVPFWQLAHKPIIKQVSLAALGSGQMLIKGGKRSPNYQFLTGSGRIAVNSQTFEWESLRPPLLVEDFASLQAKIALLPPASLRPRRLTEDFYVFAISQVETVKFSHAEQAVEAILRDANNTQVILKHPYTSRSHAGTEALLDLLVNRQLLFVAGQIYLSAVGLVLAPVSLVFQVGETRTLLQPWVHSQHSFEQLVISNQSNLLACASQIKSPDLNRISFFFQQLESALSELLLLGLERVDFQTVNNLQKIYNYGKLLGFTSLLEPINRLLTFLEQKNSLNWNWQPSALTVLEISVLFTLAQEHSRHL